MNRTLKDLLSSTCLTSSERRVLDLEIEIMGAPVLSPLGITFCHWIFCFHKLWCQYWSFRIVCEKPDYQNQRQFCQVILFFLLIRICLAAVLLNIKPQMKGRLMRRNDEHLHRTTFPYIECKSVQIKVNLFKRGFSYYAKSAILASKDFRSYNQNCWGAKRLLPVGFDPGTFCLSYKGITCTFLT